MIPKPLPSRDVARAVDGREERGDNVDCEKQVDREEEDEHLKTLLAHLQGGYIVESRRRLGRPDRR